MWTPRFLFSMRCSRGNDESFNLLCWPQGWNLCLHLDQSRCSLILNPPCLSRNFSKDISENDKITYIHWEKIKLKLKQNKTKTKKEENKTLRKDYLKIVES